MRVLLLHPEDSIDGGAWSRERWDLIVDLGYASRGTYADWSRLAKTKVVSIYEYAGQIEGYRWVNQIFELGRRRLLDRAGLDWWDILAMEKYQDLHTVYKFRQLQREVGTGRTEVAATRPHTSAAIGEQVLGGPLRLFGREKSSTLNRMTRAFRSARNLRPGQISEIVLDKWDSDYRLRGYWAKDARANAQEPCVLLPSAYSNVTRSVLAYAAQLPSRKFLLVITRKNASPSIVPANVKVVSLAAYVQAAAATRNEATELKQEWAFFCEHMQEESADFRAAAKAGVWNYLPEHLEQGLHLREAWTCLLQSEPVSGVLCGDDLNYHTRLPLILAHRTGLSAVYCSHGALDGGFLFKTPYADSYLVKGEMERDYLQKAAAIAADQIILSAPGPNRSVQQQSGEALVFFSQPYEVIGGRAEAIYREIIPRLYSVASASRRRLIIKLHPFESKRVRQKVVKLALPASKVDEVEILEGVEAQSVIARAWCGVTVDSSVAVECALSHVPFFLCGWLDLTGIGYLEQFARYKVAHVLRTPEEIERIPALVADYRPDPDILQRLWREADPNQLEEVMFGARQARLKPCAC